MNWFYSKDGQQLGPVAFSEIQRLLAEGQITEESLVWQQGTPNWVKLSTVLTAPQIPAAPEIGASPIAAAATTTAAPVVVPAAKTNGFAITSLVLSILGLFCCSIIAFNIAGIVFGHLALGQIAKTPGQQGRGLAMAGLIIGYIGLVLGIAAVIFQLSGGMVHLQHWAEEQQRLQSTQ